MVEGSRVSAALICKAHVRAKALQMAAHRLGKGHVTRVSEHLLTECEQAVVQVLAEALEQHCFTAATLGPRVAPTAKRKRS